MKKKRYLSEVIIGALLVSNGVLAYQYKTDLDDKNQTISTYSKEYKKLDDLVIKKNELLDQKDTIIETQQSEIDTYKTDIDNKNNLISQKEIEINKLNQQLSEMQKKDKELP